MFPFFLCDPFMLFGTGWTLPVFIFWSLNCWWLTMTQRFMVAIRCGPGKCSRKSRTMALDGFLCFCVRDFNHHLSCALCQFLVEIEWCQALHEYLTNHESCSHAMHWRCSANNKKRELPHTWRWRVERISKFFNNLSTFLWVRIPFVSSGIPSFFAMCTQHEWWRWNTRLSRTAMKFHFMISERMCLGSGIYENLLSISIFSFENHQHNLFASMFGSKPLLTLELTWCYSASHMCCLIYAKGPSLRRREFSFSFSCCHISTYFTATLDSGQQPTDPKADIEFIFREYPYSKKYTEWTKGLQKDIGNDKS